MTESLTQVLWVIAWFVSAVVGALIGMQKGKTAKGALLGFFFGPIGWILAALDVGFIPITLLLAVVIGVGGAAILAIERDKDEQARLEAERRAKMAQIEQSRLLAISPQSSGTEDAMLSTPPPPPTPSIFPADVVTPEQKREYLEALTELRKQRQQAGQR